MQWHDIFEDRYNQQVARYPQIPSTMMQTLAAADPTSNKVYLRWLVKLYAAGQLDVNKLNVVHADLIAFDRLKRQNNRLPRDILRYPDVAALHNAIQTHKIKPTEWSYSIEWKERTSRANVIVHCVYNKRLPVNIQIGMTNGWLGWRITDIDSHDNIQSIRKMHHGRTGLLKPIVTALHEVLGIFLKEQQPKSVRIQGSDDKREALYRSWMNWTFPGYTPEIIQWGIAFIRD